jgi:hypothetical protein
MQALGMRGVSFSVMDGGSMARLPRERIAHLWVARFSCHVLDQTQNFDRVRERGDESFDARL